MTVTLILTPNIESFLIKHAFFAILVSSSCNVDVTPMPIFYYKVQFIKDINFKLKHNWIMKDGSVYGLIKNVLNPEIQVN
jgi:hypothetical protein